MSFDELQPKGLSEEQTFAEEKPRDWKISMSNFRSLPALRTMSRFERFNLMIPKERKDAIIRNIQRRRRATELFVSSDLT